MWNRFARFSLAISEIDRCLEQKFDFAFFTGSQAVGREVLRHTAEHLTPAVLELGEEVFGPIMPVLTFDSFDSLMEELKDKDKPLALYLFSSDKKHMKRVTTELSYGGGCINDVVIHLAASEMGFGGVGASGMGSYHGKAGFDAFSHYKSIVDKKTWMDLPMRYQPYKNKLYETLLHVFMR